MIVKHVFIIHLVDMITGKYENIVWIVIIYELYVLVDSVGSTCVPLAVVALLVWWKHCDTTNVSIEIPRNADSDMLVKSEWSVLCKYTYCVNPRVDTVAQWEIDYLVFAAKCYRWLGKLGCKNPKTAALSTSKEHGDHFFFNHVSHLSMQNYKDIIPSFL